MDNIAKAIIATLKKGDGDGIFVEDDNTVLSRSAFLSLVAARQEAYSKHGLGEGSPVLLASARGSAFWQDLVALWGLGSIVIPFDPSMPRENGLVVVEATMPEAVIGDPGARRDVLTDIPIIDIVPTPGKEGEPTVIPASPDDTAAILFTSGSTGRPKGVELSHLSLTGNALSALEILNPAPDDRLLISLPFHFTSAINHFLAMGLCGATLVSLEKKHLQADLFSALKERKATCFGGAPLQLRWIAECAEDHPFALRWLMSSGDRLPVETINLLRKNLPDSKVFTVYGLTEVGGRFCFLDAEDLDAHIGSVGKPFSGMTLGIYDADMHPVQPGETGEIVATGDYLFKGYFQNPEATGEALCEHGFKTGDLGYVDETGFLFLAGRVDDVFKVSGQKVNAVIIAEALMKTGIFTDAAVQPVEHPDFGTVPHAFIAIKEGESFHKGRVLRTLRENLPRNHLPHGFTLVAEIPRTGSGKIKRGELRKMASPDYA